MQIEQKEEKKEEKKKPEPKKPRKKAGGGGKPRGKGQPNAPQTRGVLKLLTAQTKNASAAAYDLMKNQKFTKDIDKVLKDVAGLQTTGKTVLGGRRGKANGGFNEGYAEGGSGGIGDGQVVPVVSVTALQVSLAVVAVVSLLRLRVPSRLRPCVISTWVPVVALVPQQTS